MYKCTSIIGTRLKVSLGTHLKVSFKISPNIKMISGRHGTHLKLSFVRIKCYRNIHGTLSTDGNKQRGIKILPSNLMNILRKYFVWQIQLISPTRQLLTLILRNPWNSSSFQFEYTSAPSVQKIIKNLKPKSSVGHDNISSKLLRQVGGHCGLPAKYHHKSIVMHCYISKPT